MSILYDELKELYKVKAWSILNEYRHHHHNEERVDKEFKELRKSIKTLIKTLELVDSDATFYARVIDHAVYDVYVYI